MAPDLESGFGVHSRRQRELLDNIAWDELLIERLIADSPGVQPFTPAQLVRVLELVRALVQAIALIANERPRP